MSVPDLFKIVARGLQDKRLQPTDDSYRGNPDLSRFIAVYKSTTRWAAQFIRVDFDNRPDFGLTASVTIPRKGDYVHRLFLVVQMPDIYDIQIRAIRAAGGTSLTNQGNFAGPLFGWTNSIGHALIETIHLDIGGNRIATLDGRLLEVLDELYEPSEKLPVKNQMIGRVENFQTLSLLTEEPLRLYIPLPFWFTQHLAHSLPLGALSVDEVKMSVTFRGIEGLHSTDSRIPGPQARLPVDPCRPAGTIGRFLGSPFYEYGNVDDPVFYGINRRWIDGERMKEIPGLQIPDKLSMTEAYLLAEYISVDDLEAANLRAAQLEYRIPIHNALPVVDTQGFGTVRVPLPMGNPTQDILWTFNNPKALGYNSYFLATRDLSGGDPKVFVPWQLDETRFRYSYSEPISEVALFYNGVQRFKHDTPSLFRTLMPLIHYRKAARYWRYIYVYPFGLGAGAWDDREMGNPYNPRGLANWDKLSKKEIVFTMTKDTSQVYPQLMLYIWTTSWNILQIYGGRAALLFAV